MVLFLLGFGGVFFVSCLCFGLGFFLVGFWFGGFFGGWGGCGVASFFFFLFYYRVTEWLRLVGTSECSLIQSPYSKQDHLEWITQDYVQFILSIAKDEESIASPSSLF